jgi:hypothetical protein
MALGGIHGSTSKDGLVERDYNIDKLDKTCQVFSGSYARRDEQIA